MLLFKFKYYAFYQIYKKLKEQDSASIKAFVPWADLRLVVLSSSFSFMSSSVCAACPLPTNISNSLTQHDGLT